MKTIKFTLGLFLFILLLPFIMLVGGKWQEKV